MRRRPRAQPRGAIRRWTAPLVVAALCVFAWLAGCSGQTDQADPGTDPEPRALALLKPGAVLPPHADGVALADAVIVKAGRGSPADGLRLARLAADLRARMWRVGHDPIDAKEALALYGSIAKEPHVATEFACEALREHALLGGEVTHDPGVIARELARARAAYPECACTRALEPVARMVAPFASPSDLAVPAAQAASPSASAAGGAAPPVPAPSGSSPPSLDGVVIAPESPGNASARVLSVDAWGSPDRARVVVTLSAATVYQVGASVPVATPSGDAPAGRLEVTFPHASGALRDVAVGGLVERVHAAASDGGVHVTIETTTPAYRRAFYLLEPFRVVIDVAATPPTANVPVPTGTPRAVSRVVLDPGHGGTDPGAIGPGGLREKDVTLDIAHRAAPVLARELGVSVLLTRDDDRFVALDERTARANAFHADLFVSIHCNASPGASGRGVMTFVLDTSRDDVAARVAARENATSLAASADVAVVAARLGAAEDVARSRHLAELLQRTTMASLTPKWPDTMDHGVKTATFYVLVGAEMPAVLFETSFISHAIEERRLGSGEYRQRLADGVANAVRAYREGR